MKNFFQSMVQWFSYPDQLINQVNCTDQANHKTVWLNTLLMALLSGIVNAIILGGIFGGFASILMIIPMTLLLYIGFALEAVKLKLSCLIVGIKIPFYKHYNFVGSIIPVSALVSVLAGIPIIGVLVSMIIGLYMFYMEIKTISYIGNASKVKALAGLILINLIEIALVLCAFFGLLFTTTFLLAY